MDKPTMRYCLKLDKAKYYHRIDPVTMAKIISRKIKDRRIAKLIKNIAASVTHRQEDGNNG